MRPFIPILILLSLSLIACHKSGSGSGPSPNYNGDSSSLIGQWKWILQTDAKAVYGTPYDSLTPQNTGITEYLLLGSDSSWSISDNGQVTGQGRFRMKLLLSPAGPVNSLDFINHNQDSLVNHSLSNNGDTLTIFAEEIVDKFWVRVYIRQNKAPID